jgi:hypothetical protein
MCHESNDIDDIEYQKIFGSLYFIREKEKRKKQKEENSLFVVYGLCDYIELFPWLSLKYQKENPEWTLVRDKVLEKLNEGIYASIYTIPENEGGKILPKDDLYIWSDDDN